MMRVFGCRSRTKAPPALTVRILSTTFCISPALDRMSHRIALHNISPSPVCVDMYWLCHACSPNVLSIARHSYSLYWEDMQDSLHSANTSIELVLGTSNETDQVFIRVILRPCYLHWLVHSYTVIRSVHGQLYTTLSTSAAHKRAVE